MNRYLRRENAEIETLMSGYRLEIWHLDDYFFFIVIEPHYFSEKFLVLGAL